MESEDWDGKVDSGHGAIVSDLVLIPYATRLICIMNQDRIPTTDT